MPRVSQLERVAEERNDPAQQKDNGSGVRKEGPERIFHSLLEYRQRSVRLRNMRRSKELP